MRRVVCFVCFMFFPVFGEGQDNYGVQMVDEELNAIREGFEDRVDVMFRAELGKPLVRAKKRPPLGPGRGNYVRHYSFSICEFAARCFYLNEQVEEANAALVENAQHYLDHPKDINDRDSFHWHIEMVFRLVEQPKLISRKRGIFGNRKIITYRFFPLHGILHNWQKIDLHIAMQFMMMMARLQITMRRGRRI